MKVCHEEHVSTHGSSVRPVRLTFSPLPEKSINRKKTVEDLKARQGEKMIEVKIRFWTNNIAAKGHIRSKHAWASGIVMLERNSSHDIKPGQPIVFHSLVEGAQREKKY